MRGRLAVLRCRLSDLEGSLRVGLGLHQLGALAEGISVAGWSSAGCWAPLSRPDLRLPVRASRSTGASCAAVTLVGTLTSAGSAVEPTLLSDALRPKPTGNPLSPPSHPQVPLVAPRLLMDPRMAQTVNYHPQFHRLNYSTYYMVTTLIFYIIFYTASVPVFRLAVLACPLRSIRLPSLTLNRLRNFPRSLILNYLRSYGWVGCLGLLPCPLLLVIIGCHPLVSSRRKLLVNFE